MPFDENLVLADGTTDMTHANMVTSNYGHPHSVVRDGGLVVIDILAQSGLSAKGMAAVLICTTVGAAPADQLLVTIEASNDVDFVADDSNKAHTLTKFEVGGVNEGAILGNEAPCTVVRRIATKLRYIRAYVTLNDGGDDFGVVYILLAPWPYEVL